MMGNCQVRFLGRRDAATYSLLPNKKNTRSVEYKISGGQLSENQKYITFTAQKGIGGLKLIGSRDWNFYQPEQIKRARILKRADGY